MKKWIVIIVILATVFSPYFIIPNIIVLNKASTIHNNPKGIYRSLTDSNSWHNWWPGNRSRVFNGNTFYVKGIAANAVMLTVSGPSFTAPSSILMMPDTSRSTKIQWRTIIPTSYNPFKRVKLYYHASSLANDMDKLLESMKTYYADTANLYGIKIERDLVKDSLLIFTYDSGKGYPSSEKIYALIGALREYIGKVSAKVTDSPMLNISTPDSIYFLTKVAIPIDRHLSSSGKIMFKEMLGGGNILRAEVQGDSKKVEAAFTSVDNYVQDFGLTAPAIPFYSLQTNRLAEKDSTKWKTRIYYPIIYYRD